MSTAIQVELERRVSYLEQMCKDLEVARQAAEARTDTLQEWLKQQVGDLQSRSYATSARE